MQLQHKDNPFMLNSMFSITVFSWTLQEIHKVVDILFPKALMFQ